MRRLSVFALIALVFFGYACVREAAWSVRKQIRRDSPAGYLLPSEVISLLTFGYKNLASDFIFLKLATFIGGRVASGLPLEDAQWTYLEHGLDVVTDLDPYFVDPYMLAEGLLAWDAHRPEVANRLLDKGMLHRSWDWRLPFFAGFNSFYFMKDYAAGGRYLARASRMPDAPQYLAPLAARLSYYGGKSETGILFLRDMLGEVNDELLRARLQRRLLALERASSLEGVIASYENEMGVKIVHVADLITSGYLVELPDEPYGGQWILMPNGRVFSTSKFTEIFIDQQGKGER